MSGSCGLSITGEGVALGGTASVGGFLGSPSPNESFGIPRRADNPGGLPILGSVGVSSGLFISNATNFNQLSGEFRTRILSIPFASFQLDTSGDTYVISITRGPSAGASYADFTTTTPITGQSPRLRP